MTISDGFLLKVEGAEGESLFWNIKHWLVEGSVDGIQEALDVQWVHYQKLADDRVLALVAFLCVERMIDELLLSFAPGFSDLERDMDFTASMKIKIARSMRIVPSRILSGCDTIRKIRNEFAHSVKSVSFDQIDGRLIKKLAPAVKDFSDRPEDLEGGARNHFVKLVDFSMIALAAYTEQVRKMRAWLMVPESRESFKIWAIRQS